MKRVLWSLLALGLTTSIGVLVYQNRKAPKLGVSEGRLMPLKSSPNNVSSQTSDPSKRVEPLPFKETPEATMQALEEAVAAFGGGQIERQSSDYLYVVFSTRIGFRDDVEFWLDQEEQVVHFRSSSRAGYSDMGLNRQRYLKLRELYGS